MSDAQPSAETHTWTPDAQGAIDGPEPLTSNEKVSVIEALRLLRALTREVDAPIERAAVDLLESEIDRLRDVEALTRTTHEPSSCPHCESWKEALVVTEAHRKRLELRCDELEEGRCAEPPSARLLIECAEAMEENCEHEGKLSTFVDLARRCRAAAGERYCLCPPGGWVSNCPAHKLPNRAAPTKDAAQPMHGGALVAPGRCDNGECWCHGGISVETNEAQCNGNCFLVGGPFVAEDPSCPKHGNR